MNATTVNSVHMIDLNILLSSSVESLARILDISASNKITIMMIGAAAGAISEGITSKPSWLIGVPGLGLRKEFITPIASNEIRRKPSDLKMVIQLSVLIYEYSIVAELS